MKNQAVYTLEDSKLSGGGSPLGSALQTQYSSSRNPRQTFPQETDGLVPNAHGKAKGPGVAKAVLISTKLEDPELPIKSAVPRHAAETEQRAEASEVMETQGK